MLSFEMSAIDVVLSVAILILLLLFVTQRKSQSQFESQMRRPAEDETSEESEARMRISVQDHLDEQSAERFRGCVHQFGHLRSMPKNTAVPAECFGCPKVLRCMFKNE
jgi:hypothetical protein